MKKLLQLLAMLGINAVPALGWFVEGWSGGTTLALYWFENVAASLLVGLRIVLHRHWRPSKGHYRHRGKGAGAGRGSFLAQFLGTSLIFSAAHGFFLVVIIFMLTHNGKASLAEVNWSELRTGLLTVTAFLIVDFLVDLVSLKKKPFRAIEYMAERNFARVIIVHLTLIFGMAGIAFTGATKTFFGVFVTLKTLNDLGSVFPQWEPAEAPKWLCAIMNRVPNVHPGEKFEDFWKKDIATEVSRQAANELPVPRGGRGV